MWNHNYYVYILSNKNNTVVYTGVTKDLEMRVWQHKNRTNPKCFTAKYNVFNLVYFEHYTHVQEAIAREKQIKGGSRAKKELLINKENPAWKDLAESWYEDWRTEEEMKQRALDLAKLEEKDS
jgi:putative endonuclease